MLHCGDVADASKDVQLALVGVIEERRGVFALRDGDLDGYLAPKPAAATKELQINADGQTMTGNGQLSRDGTTWEQDLHITYRRAGDQHQARACQRF